MAKRASTQRDEERHEKMLDFHKIGAIMQKNFIVLIRDKTRIIPLLLFPIFMILVFGYTAGNLPKHISTAVVVYDSSPLSQELQQRIANTETFSVRYVVSTEGEAKHLLDSQAVRAVIIIPPGFQETIDSGGQAAITMMADESDTSVAAASHQGLNSLVTAFSNDVSARRVAQLQQSVAAASQELQAGGAPDLYAPIAERAAQAGATLTQSRRVTDTAARSLLLSLPVPSIYVSPLSGDHPNATGGNTYVNEPPSADAARAQASLFSMSSSFAGVASANVQAIATLASQGKAQTAAALAQKQRSAKSAAAITVFTKYRTAALLRPVTYEEKAAYGTGKRAVDFLIPTIIALTIFQGAVMGMGRAVAGEKREGSLTRVFLTPTSNATIISGTLLFYVCFELFRAAFLISISMLIFNIKIEGSFLLIALILIIFIAISTSVGMVLSSMVRTEPQYMAMAMLVSMPTLFLAGAFFPLQAMPKALQALATVLPVTYAGQALRDVMIKGFGIEYVLPPILILLVFLGVLMFLVSITFKRDIE